MTTGQEIDWNLMRWIRMVGSTKTVSRFIGITARRNVKRSKRNMKRRLMASRGYVGKEGLVETFLAKDLLLSLE